MNLSEVIKDIQSIAMKVEAAKSNAIRKAAFDTIGRYKKRLFNEGQGTTQSIGSYSTTPMYVSVAGQRRKTGSQIFNGKLRPVGKNGESTFKNGKEKKSQYFEDGYAGFRNAVGRQSNKVDLSLSGELERSIQVGLNGSKVVMGFLKDDKRQLAENLEKKYGIEIFNVSAAEAERALKIIDDEIGKIFK